MHQDIIDALNLAGRRRGYDDGGTVANAMMSDDPNQQFMANLMRAGFTPDQINSIIGSQSPQTNQTPGQTISMPHPQFIPNQPAEGSRIIANNPGGGQPNYGPPPGGLPQALRDYFGPKYNPFGEPAYNPGYNPGGGQPDYVPFLGDIAVDRGGPDVQYPPPYPMGGGPGQISDISGATFDPHAGEDPRTAPWNRNNPMSGGPDIQYPPPYPMGGGSKAGGPAGQPGGSFPSSMPGGSGAPPTFNPQYGQNPYAGLGGGYGGAGHKGGAGNKGGPSSGGGYGGMF